MAPVTPESPTADLIVHIVDRYHEGLRNDMPALIELAQKVERVHAEVPEAPLGLAGQLQRLFAEMESHMYKEEMILFPAMAQGGMPGIERPISVMRADHDEHGVIVSQIRAVTRDLTLPEGACGSWTRLYADVGRMLDDLDAHMRLENEVLFPRFETAA